MNWQPIETAPKDGTQVLLWIGGHSEPWAQTGFFEGGYWLDSYEGIDLSSPTHWMPLPPPPGKEQDVIPVLNDKPGGA